MKRKHKTYSRPKRPFDKLRIEEEAKIKKEFGLKNKSEAVAIITQIYEENFLEPELKPEYLEKLQKIRKGKYLKFNSIEDLRKATS